MVSFYKNRKKQFALSVSVISSSCNICSRPIAVFRFFFVSSKWKKKNMRGFDCNILILHKFGFPCVFIAIKWGLQSKGIKSCLHDYKGKVLNRTSKTTHQCFESSGSHWLISISNCLSFWLLLQLVSTLSSTTIGSAADCIQAQPGNWLVE